jgi:hypothetical protein
MKRGKATKRAAVGATGILLTVGAMAGFAAPAGAQTPGSPAIVGPLLTTFTFGDEIALPTGCGLAGGAIEAGAAYVPGSSSALSPFFTELNTECSTIAATGYQYLLQFAPAVAPLSAWNPILDPIIAQIGSAVQAFGNNYMAELGPLGPTVAGFGNTINYFEGS